MVLNDSLGVGILIAFVGYCESFINPVISLAQEIHIIQQAFSNSERVASFLKEPGEDKVLGPNGSHKNHLGGDIVFNDVSMAYDSSHFILKNISFSIKSSEKIGIIGRTGSGKTTMVSLLGRLYDFQKGHITIDGISIRNYSRSHLRDQIGFVSQDVIVFEGSWKDNLGLNKSSLDQIKKCCEKTGLREVMERSGKNLSSFISDKGANLSAGERQLLALTRVLIKNPSLLILDEATANMDSSHEKIVQRGIQEVMKGRTCLFIAHRHKTLIHCDRIFLFEEGKMKEISKENLLSIFQ